MKSKRDESYVKAEVAERIRETREDWRNATDKFRNERSKLLAMAVKNGKAQKVKREIKRIDKYNNSIYTAGRNKAERKVKHLKEKLARVKSPKKAAKERNKQ